MITQEQLKAILDYDPETGIFIWRGSGHGKRGTVGTVSPQGYRRIMIDYQQYPAHKLAWLYVHGEWVQLDHINLDRDDNRLLNLRKATRSENLGNCLSRRDGLKGCWFERRRRSYKKWGARIQKAGKVFRLGYFQTEKEANDAYGKAALVLQGEFARW
jgi:HNH endonuclease